LSLIYGLGEISRLTCYAADILVLPMTTVKRWSTWKYLTIKKTRTSD